VISLASNCLVFETGGGENIPCSAEMISVELTNGAAKLFDPDVVHHAANAVFHYFKHELGRQSVSPDEFAGALEKALRGLTRTQSNCAPPGQPSGWVESDLCRLARESGPGCELFFFSRLRDELCHHLQQSPRVVRFHALRPCVKRFLGARRWTPRCQTLADQIVQYLRQCLSAEAGRAHCALVIE
jgi:hypothetical protein